MITPRKPGRPRKAAGPLDRIQLRVARTRKSAWQAYAKRKGQTLTAWIESACEAKISEKTACAVRVPHDTANDR